MKLWRKTCLCLFFYFVFFSFANDNDSVNHTNPMDDNMLAYMRIDYGNENFGQGRTVMDFFKETIVVYNLKHGKIISAAFNFSDTEKKIIRSDILKLVNEYSSVPLRKLEPGETVVIFSLGYYEENKSIMAQIPLNDLSEMKKFRFLPMILKFEDRLLESSP